MINMPTPTLDEVLALARALPIADQHRLVRDLQPPKIVPLGRRGPDSVPCLICPVCSEDMVGMRRPKRQTLENGAEELSIEFHCFMNKHSWNWLLTDWESGIFFQLQQKGGPTK